MGCMRVAVSREWLLRLLKAVDGVNSKEVIPEDAKVVDCEYRGDQRLILLTVESEDLPKIGERSMILAGVVHGD